MSYNIVAVDDNPLCLEPLKMVLLMQGYTVHEFSDAQDALKYIASNCDSVDAIISDIDMPNMSGLELLAAIKDDHALRDIPVIFQTARDNHMVQKYIALGASGYVTKPYTCRHLLNSINQVLTSSKIRKQDNTQSMYA